jgi:hypothetical protein
MRRSLILRLLFILSVFSFYTNAQETGKSLAVLPLCATGIDSNYVKTAESILRVEVNKRSKSIVIPERIIRSMVGKNCCTDADCVVQIGKELQAQQVLSCNLSALGEKIIVQYFVTDITSVKQIIINQVTAKNIEDLELVMKRVAKSAVDNESINENVEVGTITGVETDKPLRRSTFKNFGASFGYMYPTSGYDNEKSKIFVFDLRWGYEIEQNYSAGLLMGIREGFAINIYGDYLLTRTDICPQIGPSLGFHFVSHNAQPTYYLDSYGNRVQENKREDGIELGLHAGVRLLRTYSFQILLQFDYIHTFNDYNDNAVVFTIGIL